MPEVLCPSCKEPLAPADVRCGACGEDPGAPEGRRRVAVRRTGTEAEPGDDGRNGDVAEDVLFAAERDCDGCDGSLIEVLDGQVVGYSLTHCDEEYCYYESTPGGVV